VDLSSPTTTNRPLGQDAELVRRLLRQPLTSGDVEDIALVLGLPLPRVQDALRELADAGLVEMRIDK